jgi:hypothetical protein
MTETIPDWMKAGWRDADGELRCVRHAPSRQILDRYAFDKNTQIEKYFENDAGIWGLFPAGFSDFEEIGKALRFIPARRRMIAAFMT